MSGSSSKLGTLLLLAFLLTAPTHSFLATGPSSLLVAKGWGVERNMALYAETLKLSPIKTLNGEVTLPGSKSLSNRILLLASLSEGKTKVRGLGLGGGTRTKSTKSTAKRRVKLEREQKELMRTLRFTKSITTYMARFASLRSHPPPPSR